MARTDSRRPDDELHHRSVPPHWWHTTVNLLWMLGALLAVLCIVNFVMGPWQLGGWFGVAAVVLWLTVYRLEAT